MRRRCKECNSTRLHAKGMCKTHYNASLPRRRRRDDIKPRRPEVKLIPAMDLVVRILADVPRLDGLCKTEPPELFDGNTPEDVREALRVCNACPVRRQCAEWVLSGASGVTTGVVGGIVLDVPPEEKTA